MKKTTLTRGAIYLLGVVIQAFGLSINTMTGLGVAPVISVPYSISELFPLSFGAATFGVYVVLVGLQWLLRPENRRWSLLLQIPFILGFSVLLEFFAGILPDCSGAPVAFRLLLLIPAFVCTGVGAGMFLYMRVVPNPVDGCAQAIGLSLGKDAGFGKNVLDLCCVAFTCLFSLIVSGQVVGVGLGTVLGMICVGRVISLFGRFFRTRLERAAGLRE